MSVKLQFSQDPCMPGYPYLSSQRQELYVPTSHPKTLCLSVPAVFPFGCFSHMRGKAKCTFPSKSAGLRWDVLPGEFPSVAPVGCVLGTALPGLSHTRLLCRAGAGGTCPLPPRSRKLFHVLMCVFRMLMAEGVLFSSCFISWI